jgi:hypothetical protein
MITFNSDLILQKELLHLEAKPKEIKKLQKKIQKKFNLKLKLKQVNYAKNFFKF